MLKSLIQPIKTNNGNTEIHNSALPELSELRSLAERVKKIIYQNVL